MSSPPPPPPPLSNPPPPGWGQPPAAPAAYDLGPAVKPPRPNVQVGAILTMVGGVLLAVGALLPWLKVTGETGNGLDDYIFENADGIRERAESPGSAWIFFGLVLLGFGIALFFAGRVLAVAILAIVVAGLSLIMVFFGLGAANDTKDFLGEGSVQFGIFVGFVGAGLAIAGSVASTAKRRR